MTEKENIKNLASKEACETCPAFNAANLKKLGLNIDEFDHVIALAGNPNVGKSTVFNALTGLRQHTGNWPGKTVTRAEGAYEYSEKRYKIVDLPGTYSLLATSLDEEVARNFILFGQPDVTIVVVDASRLERNLNLVIQVLEITDKVVVCLNLMDEAERRGLKIDERTLSKDLGVPVVPTSARYGVGIPELLAAVHEVATNQVKTNPYKIKNESPELKNAIKQIVSKLKKVYPELPNPRWVALRLLDGDEEIAEAIENGEIGSIVQVGVDDYRSLEVPA